MSPTELYGNENPVPTEQAVACLPCVAYYLETLELDTLETAEAEVEKV